eukprot:Selendium_serpulae@DN4520_c0_g1_i1.p1
MLRVSVDSLVVCDTDGDEDLTNFLRKRAAEKTKPIYSHIDKGDASDTANATDDDAGKDDDELWDNAPRKGDTVGVVLSTGQLVTAKLVITSTGGAPHCLRNSVMQRTSNCDETTSRGDQLLRPIDTSEESEEVPPSRLRVDWGWKGCLVFPDDCREGLLGVMEAEPLLSNLMSKMALGYSDSRILRWAEQQRVTTAVQPAMYHYGLRLADMGDIACDLIAMPSYVRKEEKEAQEAATRNRYDRLEELATAGDEKGPLDT